MTKEQFNEKYVKSDMVVNCMTFEDAIEFLKLANSFGYEWRDGVKYVGRYQWDDYKNKTCYYIYDGSYTSISYFKEHYKSFEIKIFSSDNTRKLYR